MVAAIFTMKKDWPVIESVSIKKNEDRNPGLNLDLSYDNLSPLPRASDISRGRGAAKSRETHKTRIRPPNSVEILSNTCLYNIVET